jgi:hypothetical protein
LVRSSVEEGVIERLLIGPYIRGEGIHIQVCWRDIAPPNSNTERDGTARLDPPDNDFDLSFLFDEKVLISWNDYNFPNDEADAKVIARKNVSRKLATIKYWIKTHGLSSPGGKPRRVLVKDIVCSSSIDGGIYAREQ